MRTAAGTAVGTAARVRPVSVEGVGSGLRLTAASDVRLRWCGPCGDERSFELMSAEPHDDGWAELACVECGEAVFVAVDAPPLQAERVDRSAA